MDSIDEAMIFAAGFEKNATIDQKNTKTTVKDNGKAIISYKSKDLLS